MMEEGADEPTAGKILTMKKRGADDGIAGGKVTMTNRETTMMERPAWAK